MLNIGRMAPGSQRYYLDHVAQRDDGPTGYYLDRGEAPGRWLGSGLDAVGLSGEVTGEQLDAVLAGNHPATGQQVSAHPARKVPGFDLAFRAPKSVSLLWGLGDPAVADQVMAAHDAAVQAAVGYLERHACFTRRGAGGAEQVPADGFIAAGFRHRTSRAGDPLVHTHVLAANLVRTSDDGVWRTLDSRVLYRHARTAGFLYQAQLRHELTARLGVGWGPVVNGCADLAGVPRQWIEAFSKRRTAILAHLHARGESSAKAAQAAMLATRQAKPIQPTEDDLRGRWLAEATRWGMDPGWDRQLLDRERPRRPPLMELYRELIADEAITATTSTFARPDLLRGLVDRLPSGAPVEAIEQIADSFLAHDPDQVIALGAAAGHLTALETIRRVDGTLVPSAGPDERRYTTAGLLATEHAAIHHALQRHDDQAGRVDAALADAVLAQQASLTGKQADMVRTLVSSGRGVEVVVGRAGTGKTYALATARKLWARAGVPVAGVALAARAALELEDSAGIASTTLARLLGRVDADPTVLPAGSVLVVDEAGMVGTRQLARLLDHAYTRQVKVVLVGDPHQLPEIDAGGLFRALARRLPAVELTDNRRQHHDWEIAALDQLRHGDPAAAIATYQAHGRLTTHTDPDQLRDQLVADWWHMTRTRPDHTSVMVALRRADVADLNTRARARMAAAGALTGPELHLDATAFQAGDRIVCLRNDRHLGVVNGTTGTLTHVDPDARTLTVATDRGATVMLPARYLDAGHLTHGYAVTGHKAQGLTVDHTFVLGSDALYREWGYVAMSRGRHTNRLYATTIDQHELCHHAPPTATQSDPAVVTARRLQRSRADQPLADQPVADHTDRDTQRLEQLQAFLDSPPVTRSIQLHQQLDTIADRHQDAYERAMRLHHRFDELAAIRRPRRDARTEYARLLDQYEQLCERTDQLADQTRDLHKQLQGLPTLGQIRHARTQARQLTDRLQPVQADPPVRDHPFRHLRRTG